MDNPRFSIGNPASIKLEKRYRSHSGAEQSACFHKVKTTWGRNDRTRCCQRFSISFCNVQDEIVTIKGDE